LPDPDYAESEYQALINCSKEALESININNSISTVSSGSLELKKENWSQEWFKGLQRKYQPASETTSSYPFGTGIPRSQLSLFLSVSKNRTHVARVWKELSLDLLPNSWMVPIMKQLTEVAKKQGEILWPSFWKDLVGFELYFGAPPIDGEKFPEQI